MYSIKYLSLTEINLLEQDWKRLEKGSSMTYFQRYDWYNSLLSYIPKDCTKYESKIAVLYKSDEVQVIAPIFVIKRTYKYLNKRGIYILGFKGWSDYLNFIYDDSTSSEDLVYIIRNIGDYYGIHDFYFTDIPDNTTFYRAIINNFLISQDISSICVDLKLPYTQDEYATLLSKSFKQNIRTAQNRLSKSNLEIKYNFDDRCVDKELCEMMRNNRLPSKEGKYNILQKMKIQLVKSLSLKFDYALPFYADANSHIMSAYINNELAAFFNYGIDQEHRKIVLMAVGTSEKYARYSPGLLLLYNYISLELINHNVDCIDFTRGNEKYKYSFGGKEHYNHSIVFSLI